jgi:phosphonate transport system permease protein
MTAVLDETDITVRSPQQRAPVQVPISPPWTLRRAALWALAIGGLLASVWGLRRVDLSFFGIIEGWPETQNLLERMWPPRIEASDRQVIVEALIDTFFMAFAGTAIGVILAVPLAFMAAANVMRVTFIRAAARGIIVFTRAVPTIVFALVFVRVYGIGVLPGILAIGIHSIGMIGKLLADSIEQIDAGPRDGVASTGAGRFQELVTGIWSQIAPNAIAVSLYRLEIDFRGSVILGFVGAGGIGVIMRGYQGNLRYPDLLGVSLLFVALVIVMEMVSTATRRALLGSDPFGTKAKNDQAQAAQNANELATSPAALDAAAGADGERSIRPPWTKDRIKINAAGAGTLALLVGSFTIPNVSFVEMFTELTKLPDIVWRMVPKNLDWLTERVFNDLVETIAIGFASTFLALLIAIPMSFLAASNTSPGRWIYRLTRLTALLVRAAPDIVIAVILVVALGLGPAAGTLALAFGLVGFAAKLMADNIEEVKQGPRDGVTATGATAGQDVGTAVTPQVLPALVGNSLYLLDISLRSSTVLGIVGAGGIGFLLQNASKTLNFEVMGGIVFSIFVIVYSIELLAGWVRKQIL